MVNKIIQEFMDRGGNVSLSSNGYSIDGFYKSGTITLKEENGQLKAYQRYNGVDEINCLDDLVCINYKWWLDSRGRWSDGFASPDHIWEKLLIEFGYIKKVTKTVTEYVVA